MQLNQISDEGLESLRYSFNYLPETTHLDGKWRLRRYSAIELRTSFWDAKLEAEISRLPRQDFVQSKDLNRHQGGMVRSFEEMEEEVLQSDGMKEALLLLKEANDFYDGQEVEIHQMRIITGTEAENDDEESAVAPEGIHQDGYKNIAMLGVDRFNITGGDLLVSESGDEDAEVMIKKVLENGNMVMLRDDIFWHNAMPIVPVNPNKQGHMDIIVFCANKV